MTHVSSARFDRANAFFSRTYDRNMVYASLESTNITEKSVDNSKNFNDKDPLLHEMIHIYDFI